MCCLEGKECTCAVWMKGCPSGNILLILVIFFSCPPLCLFFGMVLGGGLVPNSLSQSSLHPCMMMEIMYSCSSMLFHWGKMGGGGIIKRGLIPGMCPVTLRPMKHLVLTIYAPMIFTAPCIMFWMRAYTLCGEVGGDWAWNSQVFWAL